MRFIFSSWWESRQNKILGSLTAFLSLLLIFFLIPAGVQVPEENNITALSPDFWINIIAWSMFFLGGVIFLEKPRKDENECGEAYLPFFPGILRVSVAIALLFLYYHAIKIFGIVLASSVFVLIFVAFAGERRWKTAILIALILPSVLYYFFLKVTGIPMPLGIFE